jgi:hypothetical protein
MSELGPQTSAPTASGAAGDEKSSPDGAAGAPSKADIDPEQLEKARLLLERQKQLREKLLKRQAQASITLLQGHSSVVAAQDRHCNMQQPV